MGTTFYSFLACLLSTISAAVIVTASDAGVIVTNESKLLAFGSADFTVQSVYRVIQYPKFFGIAEGNLIIVPEHDGLATLEKRRYPSLNSIENYSPVVLSSSPSNDALLQTADYFQGEVIDVDKDGTVREVAVMQDGQNQAQIYGSPWLYNLVVPNFGKDALTAVTTDNRGDPITLVPVVTAADFPPTVVLTAILVGAEDSATVELRATVTDPDGTVVGVRFSDDRMEVGSLSQEPYVLILTNVPPGIHTFSAEAVDNLGYPSYPAEVLLAVNLLPGDYFTNRIVLTGIDAVSTVDATKATSEPDEPLLRLGYSAGHSVWWEWTPPIGEPGTLVLDTTGSAFDPLLVVYTGDTLQSLSLLALNGIPFGFLTNRIVTRIEQGAFKSSLKIEADAHDNRVGSVTLHLTFIPDSRDVENDNFAQRLELAALQGSVSALNTFATSEPGEPAHAGNPADRSLWWYWVAPEDGLFSISATRRGFGLIRFGVALAVYTGTSFSNLKTVVSDNLDLFRQDIVTQSVQFNTAAGVQYQIAADGFLGNTGLIELDYFFRRGFTGLLVVGLNEI